MFTQGYKRSPMGIHLVIITDIDIASYGTKEKTLGTPIDYLFGVYRTAIALSHTSMVVARRDRATHPPDCSLRGHVMGGVRLNHRHS